MATMVAGYIKHQSNRDSSKNRGTAEKALILMDRLDRVSASLARMMKATP